MFADLAKSGLTPQNIQARVTPSGYRIPFFQLDGSEHPTMYRERLAKPDGRRKYSQPAGISLPYVHPRVHSLDGDTIICAEGEKKAATCIKFLGIPTFGIGGAGNWRQEGGKVAVHEMILELIRSRNARRLVVIPDDDVRRYDLAVEYGTFLRQIKLEFPDLETKLLRPDGKIDDLLVAWGAAARERFEQIEEITTLAESAKSLTTNYGLAFKPTGKDGTGVRIHQNFSNALILLRSHPSFPPNIWFNEDTAKIMFGDKPASMDREALDVLAHLQHNLQLPQIGQSTVEQAIARRAHDNPRSPFREWLLSLQWDGTPRLEKFFVDYCGAHDTPFVREVSSKWLPGAVWRAMQPGAEVDFMVVAVGPQGIGKSSLPATLWGSEHVVSVAGQETQYKDQISKFHCGRIINLEEFDSLSVRDIGNLKALITMREDTYRKPYARDDETRKRGSILFATTNRSQFLRHDDSGQRRYAVVEFAQVRFKAIESDREQLWAEAVARWSRHKELGTLRELSNVTGATREAQRFVNEEAFLERWREWVAKSLSDSPGPLNAKIEHEGTQYLCLKTIRAYEAAGIDARGCREDQRALKEYMLATEWTFHKSWHRIEGVQQQNVWVLKVP
jgi:hypothetical protein